MLYGRLGPIFCFAMGHLKAQPSLNHFIYYCLTKHKILYVPYINISRNKFFGPMITCRENFSLISYRSKFSLFCHILRLGAFAACIFVITSFIRKLNRLCAVLKTTLLPFITICVNESSKLNPLS